MVAKLNPIITNGTRKQENQFDFNKDAGMFMCPAVKLAIRKARTGKKNQGSNQALTYYFDVEKCKQCSMKDGCYKEGAKSNTHK